MKDSEFIELLNLYLDHEISAADAARLEAEVQSNPARRSVYQSYCRMQKACKVLAQDFVAENETASDRKVVPFASVQPSRGRQLAVFGSLAAAAACVALVFVTRSHPSAAADAPALAGNVPVAAPAVDQTAVAQSDAASPRGGIERHSFEPFSLRNQQNEALALASVQNDPNFAWMQDVRLAPLQTNDAVRFNVDGAVQTNDRTFSGGKKPLPTDVKWIGYRFQK